MDVRMPDGTIVTNVPDGITQDDLLSRYQASKPAAAATSTLPGPNGQPRSQLPFTGADVAFGGRQVIDAGAQLLTRGLESIGVPGMSGQRQQVEDINKQALQDYQAGGQREYGGAGRGLGQSLVTGPMTAMKAVRGLLGLAGQGGVMGGVSGALTPVYEPGDTYWQQKGAQAGKGAALGAATAGAFGLGANVVAPKVSDAVRSLMAEGVTPTPGQMMGGAAKTAEEKLSSFPILGDAIRSAQTKGLNEYNVALYNRILTKVGEEPYKGAAGSEGIAYVGDKLSAKYDDALARSVPSVVSDEFRARMTALADMVPQAKRADFVGIINRELKVTPGNTITPSVAKDAESKFGAEIRDYMAQGGDGTQYARALQQAQTNLRQLVAKNNPEVAPEIQRINSAWSDLVQLENAANSTKVARNAGVVTPADQLRGIKKSDYSVRDRKFARGEMPNQDFALAADQVLANKFPDSGTTARALMNASVGSALGGHAIAAADPTIAAGAGLLALPYLPGGRQAMAALFARRPEGADQISEALRALAPYLAAAAPAGLLR